MPFFFSDGSTPRRTDARWAILQKILYATNLGGGGGGGGAVDSTGTNYCFSGTAPNQTFKLLNLDTGLYNQANSGGADGVQHTVLQNGSTC